jgi:hypothetical protein
VSKSFIFDRLRKTGIEIELIDNRVIRMDVVEEESKKLMEERS